VKVYLCGPINGCTDDECKNWRTQAKRLLKHETLDPMDRDFRGQEDLNISAIVEGDKDDIDNCECLLVAYDKPSVGTSMEMLWAWLGHKEVIVFTDQKKLSPWLRYHSSKIYPSIHEACDYINGLE
jgi:hypothetical protein